MKQKRLAYAIATAIGIGLSAPAMVSAAGTGTGAAGGYEQDQQQQYGAGQDQYRSGQDQYGAQDQQYGAKEQESARAGGLMQMTVSELEGQNVYNLNGDELGTISEVVKHQQDQNLHAVLSVGGFLGIGEKLISVPISELQMQGDRIVATTISSQDQLEQRTAYNEAEFSSLQGDMQLAEAQGAAGGGGQEQQLASFEELDSNGDGVISQSEAEASSVLSHNWQDADANANDNIDQAEFSAFEQTWSPGQEPGSEQQREDQGMVGQPPQQQSGMDQQQSEQQLGMGQPQQQGQLASFGELDKDGDGQISQSEASASQHLADNWQSVDINADDQIDGAEFSAFEAGYEAGTGVQPQDQTGRQPMEPVQPGNGMMRDQQQESPGMMEE